MRTSPKALGTAQETKTVNTAHDHGLIAGRLPEGGINDRGDIYILTDYEWIGEVKDHMQLNIHQTLKKALEKSDTPNTFVVWRRMARKPGRSNRHQTGPTIVALTLDRFLELLKETTT